MKAARGNLTEVGGRTSHAAVVARGLGTPCLTGVDGLEVEPAARRATFGERGIEEGDAISFDGDDGVVVAGSARRVPAQPSPRVARVLAWAGERRRVPVVA